MKLLTSAFLFMSLTLSSCVTGPDVKPGRFVDAVVACASANPHRDTIRTEVLKCVGGVATGNYMLCLDVIPFAADEVLCTIRTLLNLKAAAINSGDATPEDAVIMERLNNYLKTNRVSFE